MNEFLYNPPSPLESVTVGGMELRRGDRVRLQPRTGADANAGRIALIESIETDVDDRAQLSLLLDDDAEPGLRVTYAADEVEPLEGE